MPRRAYDDQPVYRAMVEKLRVLINEIGPEAVAGDKVKIPFLQKMIFNSTQNCGVIPLAHLGHEYADREAASCAKTTGEEIRPVIEFASCRENQFLCFRRDGIGDSRAIHYQ